MTSVFMSAPLAVVVALKLSRSPSQFVANCMNSFGWVVTTAVALYCIRTGNIVQHRRWMIRSYPWAMAFTFNRFVHVLLPVTRAGRLALKRRYGYRSRLQHFCRTSFWNGARSFHTK